MKKILTIQILLFALLLGNSVEAATYYVRATSTGGTTTTCTGLADADYDGSGTGEACAFVHPAWAIGALGTSGVMSAGDTLIIGPGSYLIGATMPNTSSSSCNDGAAAAYDCILDTIPAGADTNNKTKIYGKGYDDPTNPANVRPKLYGVQRADVLSIGSNTDLRFLDITDGSACIENGPIDGNVDGFPVQCVRSAAPFGPWSSIGLNAYSATNVIMKYVDIHGMAKKGVFAYHAGDWDLDHVNIIANGFVGWDSDGTGDDSYTGTITLTDSKIEWSGCGERYPLTVSDWSSSTDKHHCWSQGQGGFGDGIGLGDGATGNWTFVRSSVSHNTSDGVDLLHGSGAGTIKFYKSKAEGNAGNQFKANALAGWIENSKIIGNCGFFYGQSFTSTKDNTGASVAFDNCRALGNVMVFANSVNNQVLHVNNSTILSSGDCVMIMEGGAANCNGGTTIKFDNNIIYGGRDAGDDHGLWNTSGGNDTTCLFYNAASGSCSTVLPDIDNTIVYHTKNIGSDTNCSAGTNNACDVDPLFSGTIKQGCAVGGGDCVASNYYQSTDYEDQVYLQSGSPARDDASESITCDQDCTVDYNAYARGASWDIGSLEYGSVAGGGVATGFNKSVSGRVTISGRIQ